MRARITALLPFALAAAALAGVLSASASGQSTLGSPAGRTPWGHPDLQGIWNVSTLTPLERPQNAADKAVLSKDDAEAVARNERERVQNRAAPSNPNRPAPVAGGNVGTYNDFWVDRGSSSFMIDGQFRSAIIVDPVDGRVPPMTDAARKRNAGTRGTAVLPTTDALETTATQGPGAYDDIELRPFAERCLLAFGSSSGPPTLPNYGYNNLKQIVQTPNAVMILIEMVHDARIIRLNSQHPPSHVRYWMGDSIGRWEGDTLVVETTNFTNKTRYRGSSDNMKVIERIRRVDADTILYRFTIEDPDTWSRSWTGEYPWQASNEQIYEYACHEGNYAMVGIMKGERLLDSEKTKK
jgi:hypothetical protein